MHERLGVVRGAAVAAPAIVALSLVGLAACGARQDSEQVAGATPTVAASCAGLKATIVGDAQAGPIIGTDGPDVIIGGPGRDVIYGNGGDDVICGGAGPDTIHGNDGDDLILAGPGDDQVFAGRGDDEVRGGAGNDHLRGSLGADRISGGPGNDDIQGFHGADILSGGTGTDIVAGQRGNDTILCWDEETVASAAPWPEDFDSQLLGGQGNDQLIANCNEESLRLEGGPGDDRLINIDAPRPYLSGGLGNDYLEGSREQTEELNGGPGDDWLELAGGDDPGAGARGELAYGGDGSDVFLLGEYDFGRWSRVLRKTTIADYSADDSVGLPGASEVGCHINADGERGLDVGGAGVYLKGTTAATVIKGCQPQTDDLSRVASCSAMPKVCHDPAAATDCAAKALNVSQYPGWYGAACTTAVRIDHQSLAVLGYSVACGEEATVTEADARAAAARAFGFSDLGQAQPLTPSDPDDVFVFYQSPSDFGSASVVSASTGHAVFGATMLFADASEIRFPTFWYDGGLLGGNCKPASQIPTPTGYDLREGGVAIPPADLAAVAEVVEQTALPQVIELGHQIDSMVSLLYAGDGGSQAQDEWIVLISSRLKDSVL